MRISDWSSDVCSSDLVVFRAATGIGIAFDTDFLLAVAGEVGRMHFHQATVLIRDSIAIEIEIDRTLLGEGALRIERVHNLPRVSRAVTAASPTCGLVKRHRATDRKSTRLNSSH